MANCRSLASSSPNGLWPAISGAFGGAAIRAKPGSPFDRTIASSSWPLAFHGAHGHISTAELLLRHRALGAAESWTSTSLAIPPPAWVVQPLCEAFPDACPIGRCCENDQLSRHHATYGSPDILSWCAGNGLPGSVAWSSLAPSARCFGITLGAVHPMPNSKKA